MNIIEKYIEEANRVHNNKYDYSKFVYTKKIDKSTIICPIHGEFEQSMHSHLKGQGCPKCALLSRGMKRSSTKEEFIKRAREIHGDKYDYSKVNYINNKVKVCIICPEHGEFWQTPHMHLSKKNGCPECKKQKISNIKHDSKETFIKKAKEIHGDKYDYSKVKYIDSSTKVCIICPKHGEFWQIPSSHLQGKGCSQCGIEKYSQTHIMSTEEFIEKARKIHGDKYDYSKTVYKSILSYVTITCPIHGDFRQKASYHLSGNGCQKCANEMVVSNGEIEMAKYIKSIYDGTVKTSVRGILGNNLELDIYLPEIKIAFEYDGLYWHNEKNKKNDYHFKKTLECREKGIRLIHIFEDEWIYKRPIVESMIKNWVGGTNNKIYARKCEIKVLSSKEFCDFMNNNHLQGKCKASVKLGLFHNGELVSAMGFNPFISKSKIENKENTVELVRFANKIGISNVGGASKLLNYYIKHYNSSRIISYADIRWSNGNLYEKLGFTETHCSAPSYYYVINDRREYKFKYRKGNLIKEGYDKNKSEHEIMLERGIYRIYDCGKKAYQLDIN